MFHKMRRHDREITDPSVIEQILSEGKFTTIALADGDEPYLVTLSYGYDAENRRLCFHVARTGRKLDIIERNPRACATVIVDRGYTHGECEHPFRSVVMTGRMRLVTEHDEARDVMRSLLAQLEPTPDAWERMRLDDEARMNSFRALVFEIDSVCGKEGQ